MRMYKKILVLAVILIGMIGWAGDSAPFLLDTTDPLITAPITYNSLWVGGDSSAEIVISADGTEIKRVIGEDDFAWSPTTPGKHILTYTTYIDGVAQDEVYEATVYSDWKYTVEDGKAMIVETTQKSGNVTIPSELDGFPVVGLDEGLFKGCEGLTSIVIPDSIKGKGGCLYDLTQNDWAILNDESDDETIVYKSNDINHKGSTYMTTTVEGPLELSFDWKVSSERFDKLKWYLDGSEKSAISGTGSDWQTVTISIPTGEHTIKWQYSKDSSGDSGEDCGWVRLPRISMWSTFEGCTNLTQITMPSDLITKMSDMFPDSYDNLTSITLTGDVTEILQDAFAGCVALQSFVIPDGTTTIGMNAFEGCSTLTEIVIPDFVYSIGSNAFANCTGLTNVSMPFPLKVQVESGNVFDGCSENLEIVYRAPEIKNVVAKQRFPWNGKVDIKFEVEGNVNAGLSSENPAELTVTAKDIVTGEEWIAKTLTGDTGTNEGEHHVVWDMKADGLSFYSQNIKFKVGYFAKSRKYCVIDLSAGKDATEYPVSYLAVVPEGGWTDEYKTTKLVLRRIDSGSFKMGGSYDVTLTKPYYMGVFEVTQKQYELVTGNKPSNWSGDTLPVERVSWNMIRGDSSTHNWPTVKTVDSNSFVGRLQARTRLNFDIPTEAQWEYACRAGTTTTYYWGNSMDGAYTWYSGNSSSKTHVVGTKTPNAWGLYDMSGNVWEACLDWVGSLSSKENPEGPVSGSYRMARGGSFANNANSQTSVFRNEGTYPSYADYGSGFRLTLHLGE